MYLCVMGIDFASLYDFDIRFEIVPTLFFYILFILNKHTVHYFISVHTCKSEIVFLLLLDHGQVAQMDHL